MLQMPRGLRPQLLVLVMLLLGLALAPLFSAATTMSRVSLERAEQHATAKLGQSLAQAIAEGRLHPTTGDPIVGSTLAFPDGSESSVGRAVPDALRSRSVESPFADRFNGRSIIWSWARGNIGVAYVGVAIETEPHRTRSFIGLLALYMALFGLGLLLSIYLALTLLIVRPLEALGLAARRVAFGARELVIPNLPARELTSLGKSLRTMTDKLLSDERELRHHLDEINLANERLKQAQERLIRSERLASVGRLAAGLAHEVGNPIAAMLGLEELVLSGDLSAEEQQDFLRRIHAETERVHRVLRDLLDFARPISNAAGESADEPGDVAASVAETLALIRPQKAFKQIDICSELTSDLPLVTLCRPKLVQVLLNLLLNAADALKAEEDPSLGSRATPAAVNHRITIAATSDDASVSVTISDNGPGVASSVRQHLFEPFVTTKEIGKGTGLGLAVCRGLVESIGGSIYLDPAYRDGARFIVELPRFAEDPQLLGRAHNEQ